MEQILISIANDEHNSLIEKFRVAGSELTDKQQSTIFKKFYSWRLESTDRLQVGKKLCLLLRELEKQIGYSLDNNLDSIGGNITVAELVERYLKTKTSVKPNTLTNYNFVKNLLAKEDFSNKKFTNVKTSDAKLFLIKMQQDGKGYSTIKTVRDVLRSAFQMAVDDDILSKNFAFELANVVVNDSVTRGAITREQMRNFLKFVHDDMYCKYYEVVFILFYTRMCISEFCGLTLSDIDLKNSIINIDYQIQRMPDMKLIIESTKNNAGIRKLLIIEDVARCFQSIIEDRLKLKLEKIIDGYT